MLLREQRRKGGSEPVFLASLVKDKWHIWQIVDWSTDYFSGTIQLLNIKGISEPVIYLKWTEFDMGSGFGSYNESKELWSRDGKRAYLDIGTISTYIVRDRYGPDATHKTFKTSYYCSTIISKNGIEIRANNTCAPPPKSEAKKSCYDEVGKYMQGMYIFEGGEWKRQ